MQQATCLRPSAQQSITQTLRPTRPQGPPQFAARRRSARGVHAASSLAVFGAPRKSRSAGISRLAR